MFYFGELFPNTSKSEIPTKIRMSFLRCKNNVSSLKNQKKKPNPLENVNLTNWSNDSQASNSDFIGPSVYGGSVYKGNLTVSLFWIYFWCIILN